ncbi:citrate synthase/methylcitrate synthase, partial [Leucobacter sp. OLES1]
MTDTEIKKGLAGVVVDTTAISKVNPESNSLLYRGYPVQELAASQPFEAVAYLLWHGELPTPEQLASFEALERSLRPLDPRTLALLGTIPSDAHPMDIVRTAVSQLGTFDETLHRPGGWTDRELDLGRSAYLFAQLPTIVAAVQRRRRGQEPIPPRDDLDYARNFLWMTFGELPSDAAVDVFRVSMVLYAEHSFNAST